MPISALESPTLPIPTNIPSVPPSVLVPSAKGKGKADADSKEDRGYIVNSKGTYVSVLDTFKNIAPIRDAILVDTDGSGQASVSLSIVGNYSINCYLAPNGHLFWRSEYWLYKCHSKWCRLPGVGYHLWRRERGQYMAHPFDVRGCVNTFFLYLPQSGV